MDNSDETSESLLSALNKVRIPSRNHAFIRQITDAVGISEFRAVQASEPYVAAIRRGGLRDLRIYSGYRLGFTTEEEAIRVGAGADMIRPSYNTKDVWLVSHPEHGDLGRRSGSTRKPQREAALCPTCSQELPGTGICDNCD